VSDDGKEKKPQADIADEMEKALETLEEADKEKKEAIETRNGADSIVFQTKKALEDVGDKISGSDKAQVEADLKALEDVLAANPLESITKDGAEKIKAAQETLMKSSQALFSKVYEQAQAAQGAAGQAGPDASANAGQTANNAEDGVVDGDFKEV
jgi:molecular chaperone DnaK